LALGETSGKQAQAASTMRKAGVNPMGRFHVNAASTPQVSPRMPICRIDVHVK
jgi:hypothetical protein